VTGRARLLAVALLALPGLAGAAGMSIQASLDREEVALDELVRLEVRIDSPETPTLSLPTQGFDFDVVSRASSRSTSINMGGGGGMKVQQTFTYHFGLRPRRAGELTIPPIEVAAGEARGETPALLVKVLPPGSATPRPQRPGQAAPPVFGFPSGPGAAGTPPNGGSSRAWHGWERDLQLSVEVDKTEVFLGEQVTASVWVLSPVGVAETGNFKPPAYDGFWTEQLEVPRELTQQMRKRDGVPLRAYLLQRIALFPTRAGPLELGTHAIDLVVRVASDDPFYPFGDVQRVSRRSQPVTITVKPLPAGAPARFDAVNVATATLAASLSPKATQVGQPVTLRLVAEGEGNVKAWSLPAFPALAGVRAFTPSSSDQLKPRGVKFAGSRTVETVLVPEMPGTLVIPPLAWALFDPRTGAYRELKTAELRVEVSAGPGARAGGAAPAAQNTLFPGLRPIRPAGPLVRAGAPGSSWPLWALLFAPVAAFLVLTGVDRFRERHLADGGARRVRVAGRVARKRLAAASKLLGSPDAAPFFAEVERALSGYCADKLGRPAAGLTRDELARALAEAGAHPPALRALVAALDACDAGRFGGAVARQELLEIAGRAMTALEEAHWHAQGGGA
jgi:hypothetical protein